MVGEFWFPTLYFCHRHVSCVHVKEMNTWLLCLEKNKNIPESRGRWGNKHYHLEINWREECITRNQIVQIFINVSVSSLCNYWHLYKYVVTHGWVTYKHDNVKSKMEGEGGRAVRVYLGRVKDGGFFFLQMNVIVLLVRVSKWVLQTCLTPSLHRYCGAAWSCG